MPAKIVLQNKKEGAFMKKKIALLLTGTMVAGLFGGVMNVAADDSAEKIKITYMEWGDETRLKAAEEAFEAQYPNVDIVIDNCGGNYNDYVNKLKVTMAANEGPEVFKLQPGALLEQFKEYVEPLILIWNRIMEKTGRINSKRQFTIRLKMKILDGWELRPI